LSKKGHQIEEDDFKAAQAKRSVNLKQVKREEPKFKDYEPTLAPGGSGVEYVAPEPVKKDEAEKIYITTKDGANANLPAWNILTPEQQLYSKNASGWTFMDFFERARQEAFGSIG